MANPESAFFTGLETPSEILQRIGQVRSAQDTQAANTAFAGVGGINGALGRQAFTGAAALGRGLASAFGQKDPLLNVADRAKQRRDQLSNFDIGDPSSVAKTIQSLVQNGDTTSALQLAQAFKAATPKPVVDTHPWNVSQAVQDVLIGQGLTKNTATAADVAAASNQIQEQRLTLEHAKAPRNMLDDLIKIQNGKKTKEQIGTVDHMETSLNTVFGILNQKEINPDDWQQLKIAWSQITDSGVRANTAIEAFNNLGSVFTKFSKAAKSALLGEITESRIKSIRDSATNIQKKVLTPLKDSVRGSISGLLKSTKSYTDSEVASGVDSLFFKAPTIVRRGTKTLPNGTTIRVGLTSDGKTVELP